MKTEYLNKNKEPPGSNESSQIALDDFSDKVYRFITNNYQIVFIIIIRPAIWYIVPRTTLWQESININKWVSIWTSLGQYLYWLPFITETGDCK
jgi:hypothetical protein